GPAVAVEVGEGGAGRPGDPPVQPHLRGDVLETPTLFRVVGIDGDVAEQGDLAPAGDQQVRPAVAIDVGHRAAVAVEPGFAAGELVEADLPGDVLELALAQVAIQLAGVAHDLFLVLACNPAAGDEDVEQPVAVVVDQGNPSA